MGVRQPTNLRDRVYQAADRVYEQDGVVGPIELLVEMLFLDFVHREGWLKGDPHYAVLEAHIRCGSEKLTKAFGFFDDWIAERKLEPIEIPYTRASISGTVELKVTADADTDRERFFRTRYTSPDAGSKQRKKAERAKEKIPELTVFILTSDAAKCVECGGVITRADFMCLEAAQPVCLSCADLDHLEFLPSGDVAMTRRSKKHSALSAVVVEFNRRRKRYERRGLLVAAEAITQAEKECAADETQRAARRVVAAERRVGEDLDYQAEFTVAIQRRYPGCPLPEARQIAGHAAVRGSGRVGRTAAAKALDEAAIDLAVIASIRHRHTAYDALLMRGVPRHDARHQIQDAIQQVLRRWRKE